MARSFSLILPTALILAALLLPPDATARWLGGARAVTLDDLRAGAWILKAALLATALAVVIVSRLSSHAPLVAARGNAPRHDGHQRVSPIAIVLGAMLLLATLLRLHRLDTELWYDEIVSLARYVPLRVPAILSTYDSQNQHPLYSLLAHFSYVGGGAAWSIRLPAVAFGVASLWATYAFARRVPSQAESLLAVLILSISYHHVWFSQNARGYTAILFFTLLATLLFVRLAEASEAHPARLAWLYALLVALAAYTHLSAVLIATGHGVALLLGTPWRSVKARPRVVVWPVTALALSAVLTVGLYAIVLPQVIHALLTPTMQGAEVEWKNPRWLLTETLRGLGAAVPGGGLTIVIGVAAIVLGVVSYWRQSRMLVSAMLCPVVVTAFTVISLHHNLWPRFFFFAATFFVLLALRGGFIVVRAVLRAHGEKTAVAGAVALASLSAIMLPRAWQPKQQFAAAERYIQQQRAPGDAVAAVGLAGAAYRLRGAQPDWHLDSPLAALNDIERSSRRTWVVYTFPVHLRAQHAELARHVEEPPYREVRVFSATVGGGEIHVMLNDARPTP